MICRFTLDPLEDLQRPTIPLESQFHFCVGLSVKLNLVLKTVAAFFSEIELGFSWNLQTAASVQTFRCFYEDL